MFCRGNVHRLPGQCAKVSGGNVQRLPGEICKGCQGNVQGLPDNVVTHENKVNSLVPSSLGVGLAWSLTIPQSVKVPV